MYQINKDKAGEIEILHRDEKPLFCPFKPTLLVPGTITGQLTMHREPCGSWCPHFIKKMFTLKLNCQPNPTEIIIPATSLKISE